MKRKNMNSFLIKLISHKIKVWRQIFMVKVEETQTIKPIGQNYEPQVYFIEKLECLLDTLKHQSRDRHWFMRPSEWSIAAFTTEFYLYHPKRRKRSWLAAVVCYLGPVCGCCWKQHLARGSLWDWSCQRALCVCLCVCLWNSCSAPFLVGPADGKAAALPGRGPRSLGSWAGLQHPDRRSLG